MSKSNEFKPTMGIEPDSKTYFYAVKCYLKKNNIDVSQYGKYDDAVKLRDALQLLGIYATITEEDRL